MSKTSLSNVDLEIFGILVSWIKENKAEQVPMPYAKLAKAVNNPSVIPTNLGLYLGHVSSYCLEHDAPAISAIVGGSNACEPGAGFFELLGYADTKPEDRIELWLPLLKQAYKYENWDELLTKAKSE